MKKTILSAIMSISLLIAGNKVMATEISKVDVPNGTYIVGNTMFNRETATNYNGVLTTQHIMLAAKTISGENLSDMIIYYKTLEGKWTNAINSAEIVAPNNFNITKKNGVLNAIVTFDTDGAGNIASQEVFVGNTIVIPEKPTKAGYNFLGWLLNNEPFNLETKITNSLTLKASYEKIVAESITVNKETVTINAGKTFEVQSKVLPESTLDKTLTYTTSDESVATVSDKGVITALKKGTATITVSCGEIEKDISVTVSTDYTVINENELKAALNYKGSTIKALNNITLTDTIVIDKDTTLDMNNYDIIFNSNVEGASVFEIGNDTVPVMAVIKNAGLDIIANNNHQKVIHSYTGTTLTVDNCDFENTNGYYGTTVIAAYDTILNVTNSLFKNCSQAILVKTNENGMAIGNGTIVNNTFEDCNYAVFTMSDGIKGNLTELFVDSNTFTNVATFVANNGGFIGVKNNTFTVGEKTHADKHFKSSKGKLLLIDETNTISGEFTRTEDVVVNKNVTNEAELKSALINSKVLDTTILTNDIVIDTNNSGYYFVNEFKGVLEGNNYSITANNTSWKALIGEIEDNSIVKNLTMKVETFVYPIVTNLINGNLTFENVTIDSLNRNIIRQENNDSGFLANTISDGKLTFKNCVNNVNYDVTEHDYAAIFIGGIVKLTTVEFKDCVNNGDLYGVNVALLIGNSFSDTDVPLDITVDNVVNNGIIKGTETANIFSTLNNNTRFNSLNSSTEITGAGNFVVSTLGIEGIIENDLVKVMPVDGASKYVINLKQYARSIGRTWFINISYEFNNVEDIDTVVGKFITKDEYITLGGNDTDLELQSANSTGDSNVYKAMHNGQLYYVIESLIVDDYIYSFGENGKMPLVDVLVYNADNMLIGSKNIN